MIENIKIPFNDVFFYGVSLKSRDVNDIRNDIFSNILMRYLRTLKPVSNKLYRTSENNKYEYSYSFIPTKPLAWRVIKNRRVIEDIEQLSDGKYCLNYYDEHGKDSKRVLFSKQHKWQKTNYYNSVSGSTLLCSIIPKEKNGETVILQYITGETYPITLYCCPVASCNEVLTSVLNRVPEPEIMALTNYGVLYFAQKDTLNIFVQVLKEEEEKYALLHKPEVYTNEDDIASGFCFDVDNFDSTKVIGSIFDLSEAQELTDDGIRIVDTLEEVATKNIDNLSDATIGAIEEDIIEKAPQVMLAEGDEIYSLEADISNAIKMIFDATDISIDEQTVFEYDKEADFEFNESDSSDKMIDDDSESMSVLVEDIEQISQEASDLTDDEDISLDSFVIYGNTPSSQDDNNELLSVASEDEFSDDDEIDTTDAHESQELDLLSMNDEDIDDYVQTLIDSLLIDAKTINEYKDSVDDAFAAGIRELGSAAQKAPSKALEELVEDYSADAVISSNGADYFYYGETDKNGLRSGRGKTLMSDGKTAYEGEYKDDKRHGSGSFFYKDGSLCYWGSWENNLRNGFGVGVSSETGTVHSGTWHNNKPTGIGVRFDKDGNFMYVDSACHKTNGGIRVTGFSENSLFVEFWDENTLRTIKKEIFLDDLNK